jgi:seryl-tRNA synthetase
MHDIKAIRETPEAFDAAWARRGLSPQAAHILDMDARLRGVQTVLQEAQSRRNDISKLIGAAKAAKNEAEAQKLMAEVEGLKATIAEKTEEETVFGEGLKALLMALPNLPHASVPHGHDDKDNPEVRRHGTPPKIKAPKDHVTLGEDLKLMDFEGAAKMSGARFVALKGPLARLERAIAAFMLDLHTGEYGYTEVAPPLLVRDDAMYGTGQLPKFAEDQFGTTDGRWLIPTAEVSLTNLARDAIWPEGEFPLRMTAYTPCFRKEAGSAGRDTRGMIRMHQFSKVELVSITTPEASDAEHERMTACAEEVLKRLDLAYRVVQLCTGDMGFSAQKTYDLEVWLPSQNTYREISSCSNCGDFQARRMNARVRNGDGPIRFAHTLNGSALAVGRTLVAILENYQDEGGAIAIPAVLQPYMGGLKRIG